MRRAKIVCTMGPAVESAEKVAQLIKAGMNIDKMLSKWSTHGFRKTRTILRRCKLVIHWLVTDSHNKASDPNALPATERPAHSHA